MPIPVGLIGVGKHGARYAHHVRADVPELTLAALARRDVSAGEEQARAFGCRFHSDWRALVADPGVEAVLAVAPPTLNPAIVDAVISARKPLLIEKPLGPSGAAAREIVRALRAAGLPCLMAHTLRWNTVVGVVRDELPALGPLRAVMLNQRFEPSPLRWLDDPAVCAGGILLHTGVHSFDLVRWLTGREVSRVTCRVARVDTVRTEDNFTALLELAGSDVLVAVNGSRATAGRSGLIDVAGADGQIVADHFHGRAWRIRGNVHAPVTVREPAPTVREALRAFAALVARGERPRVEVEDGARAVLIAEACARSAERGTTVDVPPL
jgi:predicted dehydrogenase